jgi:hypothetical protein
VRKETRVEGDQPEAHSLRKLGVGLNVLPRLGPRRVGHHAARARCSSVAVSPTVPIIPDTHVTPLQRRGRQSRSGPRVLGWGRGDLRSSGPCGEFRQEVIGRHRLQDQLQTPSRLVMPAGAPAQIVRVPNAVPIAPASEASEVGPRRFVALCHSSAEWKYLTSARGACATGWKMTPEGGEDA